MACSQNLRVLNLIDCSGVCRGLSMDWIETLRSASKLRHIGLMLPFDFWDITLFSALLDALPKTLMWMEFRYLFDKNDYAKVRERIEQNYVGLIILK